MDSERLVVFVCEHGSAKSVVAAAHFNRLARECGLELRAVSRGTNPDDAVAPSAALGLERDGLAPGGAPRRLSAEDLTAAIRVVAFCPLPHAYGAADEVTVWDDVPRVGEGYESARDAIVERAIRLLAELAGPERGAVGGPGL